MGPAEYCQHRELRLFLLGPHYSRLQYEIWRLNRPVAPLGNNLNPMSESGVNRAALHLKG